ncbi:DNA repair protein RAD4 [Babesia caballi]|uniref:DNA repair protein RAD4 n=1 Tax=Babesia caballi TaxID=5871 RepID=A0AAV4M2H5_BABCB|nr:DNA repair protein RAD4 [Babesia caballi]
MLPRCMPADAVKVPAFAQGIQRDADFGELFTGVLQRPQLFVCACRCYEVSARLVGGVYGPGSNVALLAEAFDTDVGAWKRADFTRMVYDGVAYGARSSAKPLNRESEARYALPESCEHRGRLYVHRQNKLFVYNLGEELSVAAIVVFSKPVTGRVVLNVAEFPFEEEEFRLRLVQSKQKPGAKEPPREYAYVFGCNRLGWLSELTPKYVERYNDICVKRGQPLQDWITETLELLNDRLRSLPGIGIVSLLERAEAKWMDARISNDPLPASKNKLKNHPIYVLASQIGNNRIKKSGAAPIAYLKGEEVFLRSDLEELKTRGGWRKVNRRVLDDAQPITARRAYDKRTRMHVVASLFSESQTELVPQAEAADGGIPTTQYDNVDATGKRFIPQGTIYLRSKRPELLFRAARALGISHKRAFSSYQKVDAFKPEIDGVVVRKGDLPALLTRYEELAAEATEREFEAHKESYRNFWRSVFKTLLADPPSVAQEHHRSIRRKLNDQVTSFLNRLEHIS